MTTTPNPEADSIKREIDRTREQLRGTVDALAVELSPRTQALRATEQTKQMVASRPGLAVAAGVAGVVLVVGVPMWRRAR
ncbi:MAG: DUF3618 domain-containing protein [Actinomycetota bacterium]|nr:DUF3618 domain-containing protein [Actinomycetota bacterium]